MMNHLGQQFNVSVSSLTLGSLYDIILRFSKYSNLDDYWKKVCQDIRWILPFKRMCCILWEQEGDYRIATAIQQGKPVELAFANGEIHKSHVMKYILKGQTQWIPVKEIEFVPQEDPLADWIVDKNADLLFSVPITLPEGQIGCILFAVANVDEADRVMLTALTSIYALHAGMSFTLLKSLEERKRKEEELRQSEYRYSVLFQRSNDGILLLTKEGSITGNNSRTLALFGYDEEELHQLRLESLLSEESQSSLPQIFQVLAETGSIQFNATGIRKDASQVPIEISASLFEVDGKPVIQALVRDVTVLKLAMDQLQNQATQLQDKNALLERTLEDLKIAQNQLIESEKLAALGQLIAGIAHEINSPLGVVKASANNMQQAKTAIIDDLPMILKNSTSDKVDVALDLIKIALDSKIELSSREERKLKRNLIEIFTQENIPEAEMAAETLMSMGISQDVTSYIKRLGDEVQPYLNFVYNISSLDKNNKNILFAVDRASKIIFALKSYVHYEHTGEMNPGQVKDGIDIILTLYHHQIKQGINVTTKFESVPNILCRADELNQVWTNLIQNAIQAMNYKGNLDVDLHQEGDYVVVNITDSGAGIPEELQCRIFQPFFTTKPRGEGSGLGLGIVKKIIEKHKGTISFASVPGRTTFTVKLPIEPAEQKTGE